MENALAVLLLGYKDDASNNASPVTNYEVWLKAGRGRSRSTVRNALALPILSIGRTLNLPG